MLYRLQQVVVAPFEDELQDRALLVGEEFVEHVYGGGADLDLGLLGGGVGGVRGAVGLGRGHLHAVYATGGQVVVGGAALGGGQVQGDGVFCCLLTFEGNLMGEKS